MRALEDAVRTKKFIDTLKTMFLWNICFSSGDYPYKIRQVVSNKQNKFKYVDRINE